MASFARAHVSRDHSSVTAPVDMAAACCEKETQQLQASGVAAHANLLQLDPKSGAIYPAHTRKQLYNRAQTMKEENMMHGGAIQNRFEPYEMNGGSVVALAGDDFCVVASDTRLVRGYSILSRNTSKLHKLTEKCVLGTGGCLTDVNTLQKTLDARCVMYKHDHNEEMSTEGMSQLLGNTLYYRRFFPFYAFNILCGLDKEGKGAIYGYDAVGSFARQIDGYSANGEAAKLIMPVLDNLRGTGSGVGRNRTDDVPKLTAQMAVDYIKATFISAGERDITCGDAVEIILIKKDGMTKELFPLKAD